MAQAPIRLVGMEKVLRNLNREISKIEGRTLKGLIRSAILIRRDMEATPPLIPVDTGNLRASFYTITTKPVEGQVKSTSFEKDEGGKLAQGHVEALQEAQSELSYFGKNPVVAIGFSAYYAFKVHEDKMARFKRPGAGAKFLEAAIKRNEKKILDIIKSEARIQK